MLHKRHLTLSIILVASLNTAGKHLAPSDTTHIKRYNERSNPGSHLYFARDFNQITAPELHLTSDPITIPDQILPDSAEYYRDKAAEFQQEVVRRNAIVGNLTDLYALELPVGIAPPNGDTNYTIIISEISGDIKGAVLEAYFVFELPNTGDKVAFRGRNIKFSYEGALIGSGRLELIGNYAIKLNDKALLTLLGKGNTFVEFNCNGFSGMGIEAEVEFSRDLIIPEDEAGKQKPAPERIKTKFTTLAQHWNDILVGVTIPPFQVQGLKDVGFSVTQAFIDWSDLANPAGLMFPPGYTSPFVEAGQPAKWQGFFLQRLDVRLPRSFSRKQSNARITIGVDNMILDDQGLSGTFFAENVLIAGDMSGWAYTIDRVGLELVINQVKGFDLAGRISIPKIRQKNPDTPAQFGYLAQRGADGNYIFAVKIENGLRLPALIADINLLQGSSIVVKEKNDRFFPSAILNGTLSIKGTGKGPKANFSGIRFEGMVISSEEPHFDITSLGFGTGDPHSVSGFPVVITNIAAKKSGKDKLGIGFDLTINIGGDATEEGFGGTASLTVWGKQNDKPLRDAEGDIIGSEQDNWEFDRIELSGVGIRIKKPEVYELAGTIHFFEEDVIYGNGFKGTVSGNISKFGGIQADALFGKTSGFRYWYADALVTLKTGVPLMPGVLFATGFGGGFYSKMKQTTQALASPLGKTQSGIYYVPDENTMGIKAIMNIGTARPEAMNGDVALEVAMNRNGGINSVSLTGNANFMSFAAMGEGKIKELASSAVSGKLAEKLASLIKGQVFGSMKLQFDNVNDVFHGNLEIYVNVAGGVVRGVGPGNKAGWAVMHFERSDWYVLIGTPDQPIGLEVAKIFKAKSYVMLGQNLPGSPPPPPQVSEILGNVDLDYMRDMNALESGMGFAFGLHFLVDTGDLRFLMFYGRFAAGTGIDFMLKDYGENYHCAGSSGAIGINGWYANGQAYAFVMGKIGIKINLKFYKGNYDILSIGAAAILQAKGPNPFWMKGTVGGYYKILGGVVKGKCKFEVTVGKECKPVNNQNLLEDIKIIAEVSPQNGASKISVFNTPQIAFNIPIGEIFDITDLENKTHSFKATLDEFFLFNGSEKLAGALEWNANNDVVIFDARDILPGEQRIQLHVKLTFEERINGIWTKVKFEGKVVDERVRVEFETDKAPDYIPENNVAVSYPLNGQLNFYPKEYNQGFIQLRDGQPYLFQTGVTTIQKIRLTNKATQAYVESDLVYNASDKRVTFSIPSTLENASVYNLEILNIPRQKNLIDANITQIQTELHTSAEKGTATLTTKQIEGQLDRLEVRTLFNSSFRSSKYNTFAEKMDRVKLGQTFRLQPASDVFQLTSHLSGDEGFDKAELSGLMESKPLISVEAVLQNNSWYDNAVYPLVYDGYPLLGWITVRPVRNPALFGIPPVRNIHFGNIIDRQALNNDATAVVVNPFGGEEIVYNLAESVTADYKIIQHQAVNYLASNPASSTLRLRKFITEPIPTVRYGTYRIKLKYIVPTAVREVSSYELELFNRVKDH